MILHALRHSHQNSWHCILIIQANCSVILGVPGYKIPIFVNTEKGIFALNLDTTAYKAHSFRTGYALSLQWKVFHPTLLRLKENRSQINTPITMGLKKLSCKVSIYPQSHYFLNPNDGAWLNGCHSKPPSSVLVAEPQLRVLLAIHSRFGSNEVLSGFSMTFGDIWNFNLDLCTSQSQGIIDHWSFQTVDMSTQYGEW